MKKNLIVLMLSVLVAGGAGIMWQPVSRISIAAARARIRFLICCSLGIIPKNENPKGFLYYIMPNGKNQDKVAPTKRLWCDEAVDNFYSTG